MRFNKHNPLSGLRMTPSEKSAGRFLRAPEGHDAAPAADGTADAPAADPTPDADAVTPPAADADGSILGGARSPGADGAGGEAEGGAAADADATSGDVADAEAAPLDAPFEGLAAPEGFTALDADALTAATPILRGLGVDTPERAQEVLNEFAPVLSGLVEKAVTAQAEAGKAAQDQIATAWADEIRNDPDLGGANYERTVAAAAEVLDTFFDPEFREFLNVTKLGNNPAMMRGIAKIHSQIQQGTIHLGGAGHKQLAPHQKLYSSAFDGPQPTA